MYMKYYQCMINGQNFLIDIGGKVQKCGFYKTVFVDSEDPEKAELAAIEKIKNSELKDMTLNTKDDIPMLYLDEIHELIKSCVTDNKAGFSFYKEKRWWQFWE